MLGCDEVQRDLSDYLDGRVGFWRRLAIRMHVAMCDRCGPILRSLRRTVDLLRAMRDEPAAAPGPEEE